MIKIRFSCWLALLLLLFLLPPTVRAQTPPLTFTATPAFGGNYVVGAWLPIAVTLRNEGPAFTAVIAATLPDNPNRFSLELELPQGAQKQTTLYVPMSQELRNLEVGLEKKGGESISRQQITVMPRAGERLLGILASQTLNLALPKRQDLQTMPFTTFELQIATFPEQALGLESVTLLLLADLPREALNPAQQQALFGWVKSGGHLIIGGGAAAQNTLAGLPLPLRPAAPGEPRNLDASALGLGVALLGVQLQPLTATTTFGPSDAPLWVQKQVGLGRVTQLAFAPDQEALSTWSNAPTFWNWLLQPALLISNGSDFTTNVKGFQENTLTRAIGYLPALNLPPIDLFLGFLIIYALLIGPGITLVLRRIDRQAWGWVVLPALALVFGGIGFGLANLLRPDERIISKVSLIEQLGADQAQARTVIGILSPRNEQFTLHLAQTAFSRPLHNFGGPFGSIDGAQGDFRQQTDSFNILVKRWNLQGLIAEQQISFPDLAAEIVFSNTEMYAQVQNTTSQVLRDVTVVYGNQFTRLGDLAVGEQKKAAWPPAPPLDARVAATDLSLSQLLLGAKMAEGQATGNLPDRRVAVREALLSAAATRGPKPPDQEPLVLAWLDQSPLAIEVAAPGAATQQVTLLVAHPRIRGSGQITIPMGWLRPDPDSDRVKSCSSSEQRGLSLQNPPLTFTLRLPADLAAIQPLTVTVALDSERKWPNSGVRTKIFDWQTGQWQTTDFAGPGEFTLPEPARFLQKGALRLQLEGQIDAGLCLFVGTKLTGKMP